MWDALGGLMSEEQNPFASKLLAFPSMWIPKIVRFFFNPSLSMSQSSWVRPTNDMSMCTRDQLTLNELLNSTTPLTFCLCIDPNGLKLKSMTLRVTFLSRPLETVAIPSPLISFHPRNSALREMLNSSISNKYLAPSSVMLFLLRLRHLMEESPLNPSQTIWRALSPMRLLSKSSSVILFSIVFQHIPAQELVGISVNVRVLGNIQEVAYVRYFVKRSNSSTSWHLVVWKLKLL